MLWNLLSNPTTMADVKGGHLPYWRPNAGARTGETETEPLVPGSAPNGKTYPVLSRSVSAMRPEYDVVVVGSGYGGGVAASRIARAGKSVAVLELGKEKWPGQYPSGLKAAKSELHISGHYCKSTGLFKNSKLGKTTGLYHLILGDGQNALVGNGLGGTSLINANVFLECDKRTLELDAWPESIRKDPFSLKKYYAAAAKMLQPTQYPKDYPNLQKLSVLQEQSRILGLEENFYRVPQTTFFHNGLNSTGVRMNASTGSGQDMTGVNDGSKNSVLMTYIADAWNWGAELFCECEVRYIRKDKEGSGYTIFFAWHGYHRSSFKKVFYSQLMWVKAREICFLGAGALGTTEILLRSQAHGLSLSPVIGQKLSGNGDFLAFGYNSDEIVNGIGRETSSKGVPCGPTITGIIDNRGPKAAPNVLDGHVIQEGAIPKVLAPLVQPVLEALPGKIHPKPFTMPQRLRHFSSRMKNRIRGPYAKGSSVNRTQTYLIMSHDTNEGSLTLENDSPCLEFSGVTRTEHVQHIKKILEKATNGIGGTLINSPFYAAFNSKKQITVHPLGGAIMSSDNTGRKGATNHLGQVFTGNGSEIYEGLVCVDGAIIPSSLGVNPLATITALAERSVDLIAHQRGWTIDQSENGELNLFGKPTQSRDMIHKETHARTTTDFAENDGGIRFTETMEGYVHIGSDIDDFDLAENTAIGCASLGRLYLSINAQDVDILLRDPDHAAPATGSFACVALSKEPLLITSGKVQFFIPDENVSDAKSIVYKLSLLSTDNETYLLEGLKNIDSSIAFSVSGAWRATTTLYTTIKHPDGTLAGKGKLKISWSNFVSELKTIRSSTETKPSRRKTGKWKFIRYFARNTAGYIFSPFRPFSLPASGTEGYLPKIPPSQTVTLTADDGIQTIMKVWTPDITPSTPRSESKVPILFIPGAAVDDQIFALPTIPTNTVEYFTSRGHTAYVTTLRFGISPSVKEGHTAYDARLDVVAAMRYVREQYQNRKFYVVTHCVGAISTSMALLEGLVPADWFQGMTVSQAFFYQKFGAVNRWKVALGPKLLPKLYRFLARDTWFRTTPHPTHETPFHRALDTLLRLYPTRAPDLCNDPTCHRCSLAFGRLWVHANLNRATHSHLHSFFNGLHMDFLSHLTAMGAAGEACDNEGRSLVTADGLERFRGLKVLFLAGGKNVVFVPESTGRACEVLRERFSGGDYRRKVVRGYGHLDLWMGRGSVRDVYPRVWGHVLETSEGG
ncbi:FAD/NAD(P)-binding domain-containing protein, partial [Patellaria atrata CBS 101060]